MKLAGKSLILVRGLGGTGKTTLSANLSRILKIPVLNRDDVKEAIRDFQFDLNLQSEIGYRVMNQLAMVQLNNGVSVLLDANARFRSMQSYYDEMTKETNSSLYVINLICGDEDQWRKRILDRADSHPVSFEVTKSMSIDSFELKDQISIDTSKFSSDEVVSQALEFLQRFGEGPHSK